MDPNATLEEIRNRVQDIRAATNDGDAAEHALRLAELVEAMDGWLSKGGFAPADWDHTVQVCQCCNTDELEDEKGNVRMHEGKPLCEDCWHDKGL